jgi:hypothetical protein
MAYKCLILQKIRALALIPEWTPASATFVYPARKGRISEIQGP